MTKVQLQAKLRQARTENARLRRQIESWKKNAQIAARIATEIRERYYQTTQGKLEEDRIDFASGKPGYEERSRARGLR